MQNFAQHQFAANIEVAFQNDEGVRYGGANSPKKDIMRF